VVEINGLPLEKQRDEIMRKRRHGMGFLGLGSTLTMLGMKYGQPDSLEFTEQVAREMAIAGWKEALELAREKGPAPIMEETFELTGDMLRHRPEMQADGYKVGDKVPGKVLLSKYSRYMQQLAEYEPELIDALAQEGARFTHHTSIAPTGTISLSLANNVSNGIEPSFAHHYSRNVIREGRKTKEKVEVYSYELLAYRTLVNPNAMPHAQGRPMTYRPKRMSTYRRRPRNGSIPPYRKPPMCPRTSPTRISRTSIPTHTAWGLRVVRRSASIQRRSRAYW
jgi:ribonucleoside-diphosphate reductase alpha chain